MGKHKKTNVVRAYKRLLEADQDCDYAFLLELERKKLQRMAKYFEEACFTDNDALVAREVTLCVRLLDIILDKERFRDVWSEEVSKLCETKFTQIEGKQLYQFDHVLHGLIPDFPKYVNLRNAARFLPRARRLDLEAKTEEDRKYWAEHIKEDVRSAKAWHLYHLVREYKMLEWWG